MSSGRQQTPAITFSEFLHQFIARGQPSQVRAIKEYDADTHEISMMTIFRGSAVAELPDESTTSEIHLEASFQFDDGFDRSGPWFQLMVDRTTFQYRVVDKTSGAFESCIRTMEFIEDDHAAITDCTIHELAMRVSDTSRNAAC